MIVDSHSHLNSRAFDNDRDEVAERTLAGGVWMINVGSEYKTSKKAAEIAEKYKEGVYAAIGLHPIHCDKEVFDKRRFLGLAKSKKIVAIGEIGLDCYKDYEIFKEKQKKAFLEQLDLVKELNLPVIIHCRMAHQDLIEILKSQIPMTNAQSNPKSQIPIRGVIHCFTGKWKEAEEYLKMGFYLGINGIIYKLNLREVIEKTPLDRILVETDCPYLVPPAANTGRNEPLFVEYIAREIAKIKNINFQKVADTTAQNAKNLFGI